MKLNPYLYFYGSRIRSKDSTGLIKDLLLLFLQIFHTQYNTNRKYKQKYNRIYTNNIHKNTQ